MIALNTTADIKHTYKVRCPECRGRIFDMVIPEHNVCQHDYKVIIDKESKSDITIKCQKCGVVVGISINM